MKLDHINKAIELTRKLLEMAKKELEYQYNELHKTHEFEYTDIPYFIDMWASEVKSLRLRLADLGRRKALEIRRIRIDLAYSFRRIVYLESKSMDYNWLINHRDMYNFSYREHTKNIWNCYKRKIYL